MGVDLVDAIDEGRLLTRLADDPALLVDTLFVCVMDEAEKRGVTDEQFGESLGGDTLGGAIHALTWEIVDFFPPEKREMLGALLRKTEATAPAMAGMLAERIEKTDVEKMLRADLDKRFAQFESATD